MLCLPCMGYTESLHAASAPAATGTITTWACSQAARPRARTAPVPVTLHPPPDCLGAACAGAPPRGMPPRPPRAVPPQDDQTHRPAPDSHHKRARPYVADAQAAALPTKQRKVRWDLPPPVGYGAPPRAALGDARQKMAPQRGAVYYHTHGAAAGRAAQGSENVPPDYKVSGHAAPRVPGLPFGGV